MGVGLETKICSKCGLELPKTNEFFYKSIKSKDGLEWYCKKCQSERGKKYREKNKEHISKYDKEYRKKHKETISKRMKVYHKQYNEKNKEAIAERVKRYYEKNKEHILKHNKEYHEKHKENVNNYYKKWAQENNDKMRKNNQNRRSRKKQVPATLTTKQWEQIKSTFNNKCAYCGKEKPLAQEHFIPLTKGGEYTVNNIIPACQSCNSSKKDKDFFEWYPKYHYYSKKREKIILDFLNYKNNKQQLKII